MRAFRPLLIVGLLAGCPKQGVIDPVRVDDCTFETKLMPGVPGSPGHLIASERNPNGASELATHMRLMVDDLREARAKLKLGERPKPLWATHRKLRCAWPTALSDRTPAFDAMAQTYLTRVKALDEATTERPAAYGAVVAACRACHEQTCDGPIAVIDTLGFDAN